MANSMDRYREKFKKMKEKSERRGGGEYPFNFGALEDGKNVIHVFGPWEEDGADFNRELAFHRDIGEEKKKILCPKSVNAKAKCPICELVEKKRDEAKKHKRDSPENKRLWTQAGKLAARTRFFINGVHLSKTGPVASPKHKEKPLKKPEVFEIPQTVAQEIYKYLVGSDDMDICGKFWEEDTRYDFIIMRSGDGLDTEYDVTPTKKYADVDVSELEEEKHNLDDVIPGPLTYKAIYAILKGLEYDPDEDEELKTKKKGVEEDEEEEVEEEDEERPAKKKGKKPADEDEEEDQEDESEEAKDEDEEEEEKPKKGSKKKPVDDDEEEEEEPPACFGDKDDYDPEDKTCVKCPFQERCLKKQIETAKEDDDKKGLKIAKEHLAALKEDADEEPEDKETDEEPEEDEEEERPAKKSKKAKDEDEEDQEDESDEPDEEEEPEEDDEEEAPKKKGKKKAADEDDEEDEPAEDEDEEDESEIEKKMRAKVKKGKK